MSGLVLLKLVSTMAVLQLYANIVYLLISLTTELSEGERTRYLWLLKANKLDCSVNWVWCLEKRSPVVKIVGKQLIKKRYIFCLVLASGKTKLYWCKHMFLQYILGVSLVHCLKTTNDD